MHAIAVVTSSVSMDEMMSSVKEVKLFFSQNMVH